MLTSFGTTAVPLWTSSLIAPAQPDACDATTNGKSLRKCPKVGSGVSVHQNRKLAEGGADAPNDMPDRSARLVIAFQNPGDRHVRVRGRIFLTVAQRQIPGFVGIGSHLPNRERPVTGGQWCRRIREDSLSKGYALIVNGKSIGAFLGKRWRRKLNLPRGSLTHHRFDLRNVHAREPKHIQVRRPGTGESEHLIKRVETGDRFRGFFNCLLGRVT